MNKYFEYLRNAGYHLNDVGQYWRTAALYRGGKNPSALSINKRTGVFTDFATGDSGSFKKLVKLIGGEIQGGFFDQEENYVPKERFKLTKIYPLEILKTLVPHYDLFLKRGISKETLEKFQAGLDHSGKLARRICFPIFNMKGQIIGFDGRWYAQQTPSKLTAKWKKNGHKNDWVYPCHLNREIILEKKEVILVESIGDLLALWDAGIKNAMCIFGTSISAKLLIYLVGLNVNKVIIATNNEIDNDSIGNRAAKKAELKLSKFLELEKIKICLPTKKDFGEMNKTEITNWYENTKSNF